MNARIDKLKELLKQSPSDSFILFALAKEFEKVGDRLQAIKLLESLLKINPDYVGAYYHLAALLKDEEKLNDALKIYTLGIEIAQKFGEQNTLRELQNAKMNLEIEMDD